MSSILIGMCSHSAHREAMHVAGVHHVVGPLRYDGGALHGVAQGLDHVGRSAGLLRVREDLLHEQVVLLDALDRLDHKVAKLKLKNKSIS